MDLGVLFALFTASCVSAAHLTQTSYKAAVVLCLLTSSYFFYQHFFKHTWQGYNTRETRIFFWLVILSGSLVRVLVSIKGYGNYDSVSWEQVGQILARGDNVYDHTTRYNTSPLWFWILSALNKVASIGNVISYRSWIRIFLSGVDLATAILIWKNARYLGVPKVVALSFFYLNPVSILLSSYHAQFENIAIFFLLTGVCLYSKPSPSLKWRQALIWTFVTLGLIAKHNICYEVPIVLRAVFGKLKNWALLFMLSSLAFFASFWPYWHESGQAIVKNVLLYGSYPMAYGISTFVQAGWLKYIFLAALLGYAFIQRSQDLITRCLQGTLFFLTFTPGFGHQYLVLPVALGALRPSKTFLVFTFVASLAIMGSDRNIYIQALSWVPLNAVWACVLLWFVSVHAQTSETSGPLGRVVHEGKKESRA